MLVRTLVRFCALIMVIKHFGETMSQVVPQSITKPRIAIISAQWHAEIVGQSRQSAIAELKRNGVSAKQISLYEVPGAFEIPLFALKLAQSGRFDAVIACALVVDGGIYRHEFVATAVIDGLMRVQLDTGMPVFSAVLTPHAFHEHAEHQQYFTQHFVIKGREVAQACIATLEALAKTER
jgi:6,7-dimethyl-8-ribityllumazine synthase